MLYYVTVNTQKHRAVHANGKTVQNELHCNIWPKKFHVNSETNGIKEENGEENEAKRENNFARYSQPSSGSAPTNLTKNATKIFGVGGSICTKHTGPFLTPQQLFMQYVYCNRDYKYSSVP